MAMAFNPLMLAASRTIWRCNCVYRAGTVMTTSVMGNPAKDWVMDFKWDRMYAEICSGYLLSSLLFCFMLIIGLLLPSSTMLNATESCMRLTIGSENLAPMSRLQSWTTSFGRVVILVFAMKPAMKGGSPDAGKHT